MPQDPLSFSNPYMNFNSYNNQWKPPYSQNFGNYTPQSWNNCQNPCPNYQSPSSQWQQPQGNSSPPQGNWQQSPQWRGGK